MPSGKVKSIKEAGHVKDVTATYTPEDAAKHGKHEKVLCSQGWARISRPEILHGSTTTSQHFQGRQRTVLPWYSGVGADNVTLDTIDSDSWDGLAVWYLKQAALGRTPSGHSNKYSKIPHRFPAGVHLPLGYPVSEALVCRHLWDDPVVVHHANELLSGSSEWLEQELIRIRL